MRRVSNRTAPGALLLALATALAAGPAPVLGQQGDTPGAYGRVTGRVVDADTGAPLAGVVVQLDGPDRPASAGARPRTAISDAGGRYAFERLDPGSYRLHGSLLGYRTFSVSLDVPATGDRRVSVGLVVEPVRLTGVELHVERPQPFLRTPTPTGRGAEPARAATAGSGANATIAIDAREITESGVFSAITLAEPDLLRSLHRLPSVGTRSDYTAELWTRGAAWHETRVLFDGVPLFNPLLGVGAFSGIGRGGIGSAVLHPGVRPASFAEGAAGTLDVRTRRGGRADGRSVEIDLSVVSGGFAVDHEHAGGRVAWMAAGRRSHLDWLTRVASATARDPDRYIPYAFGDLVGRLDLAPHPAHRLEISALGGRDRVLGAAGAEGSWGNGAVGLSHQLELPGFTLRHTLGGSRNHGRFPDAAELPVPLGVPLQGSAAVTAIRYHSLAGELASRDPSGAPPRKSGGYEIVRQSASFHGPGPLPVPRPLYSLAPDTPVSGNSLAEESSSAATVADSELRYVALWGERMDERGPLTLQGGARIELGGSIAGAGAIRAAPRVSIRLRVAPAASLSAGLARTYQYSQAVAPAGLHLASLSSSYRWAVAGPHVPALRADLMTAGARFLTPLGFELGASVYHRETGGALSPDPRPGPLFGRDLEVGSTAASGIELDLRAGRDSWSLDAAYTLASARARAAGWRYPAATERRHTLALNAVLSPGTRWTWAAAFAAASGIPFTRVYAAEPLCGETGPCGSGPVAWIGAPNAGRARPYASLDFLVERRARAFGGTWDLFVQLRNATGRRNETFYADVLTTCDATRCDVAERAEPGMPRLLLAGSRLRW
jgi:hypothetical protein